MDTQKMWQIRASGGVSIRNEHDAVLHSFPNFQDGIYIPYSKDRLQDLLEENIPQLKQGGHPPYPHISLN